MVNVTIGLSSLGDVGADQPVFNISLEVSKNLYPTQFELWIFDGDMGGDWDRHQGTYDHITFSLYPDPDFEGNTTGAWRTWAGSSMVDNGWWSVVVPHDPAALSPDGNWYRYHLVSEWTESGDCTGLCDDQQNNFKVSVQGTPFLLAGSTIGFQAFGPAPRPDTWDPLTMDPLPIKAGSDSCSGWRTKTRR